MKVVLTMPSAGNNIAHGAARGFYTWPSQKHEVIRIQSGHSSANHTFNVLWCNALELRKRGFTHFAMAHSDIDPEQWWLDILLDELNAHHADVVSAVVPIKCMDGITSTALDHGDLWNPERLTMKQVMELPETFSALDVGCPLLLNHGLFVCDITKPWVEAFTFEELHRIAKTESGHFVPQMISDDWLASRCWNQWGLKILATRKVKLAHDGGFAYRNDSAWGDWDKDEAYMPHKSEETVCA